MIKEQNVAEFKICNGVMLLLHNYIDETVSIFIFFKDDFQIDFANDFDQG